MRRYLPALVASIAVVASAALVVIALATREWSDALLGVIAVSLIALVGYGLRMQRRATKRQEERLRAMGDSLSDAAEVTRILSSRPERLSLENAAPSDDLRSQLEWIARRQAEIVRLLKDDRTSTDEA